MVLRLRELYARRPSVAALTVVLMGLIALLALDLSGGAIASGRGEFDRPALRRHSLLRSGGGVPALPLVLAPRLLAQAPPEAFTAPGKHLDDGHNHDHDVSAASASVTPVEPVDPLRRSGREDRAFAGLEHLFLHLPQQARVIGFHESGTYGALSLHPMGIPRINANVPRLPQAPVGDGFEYVVMATRGRSNGPTSAVDIAMPNNVTVHAPVTGTVVDATAYLLYRRVPDNMVFIVPDSRPDVVVVMMHVNGLLVSAGDRVVAEQTPIALTARLLPFASQIDQYAGRLPHVHIEVRRR